MNETLQQNCDVDACETSNNRKTSHSARSLVTGYARREGLVLTLLVMAWTAWAAPTPMETTLTEDDTTLIECDVRDAKETMAIFTRAAGGEENPLKSSKTDGYHYKLYIPKGYYANTEYRYPCLFIASPSGNADMGGMAERLKRDQWVVVMLQEGRNGTPDWFRNFLAAHDDVVERVRIAKGAKFSTGMSGGARCSSVYAILRPGMAGIICQGAGFAYEFEPDRDFYASYPPEILVAGSFGDADSNLFESQDFLRRLKQSRVQIRFFNGGHTWCPQGTFDSLMDWMEESLFLDAPKPARTTGPGPSATVKNTGSKVVKKHERPGTDAFQWYLRKCRLLLEAAQGNPARCFMLECILGVVANGKLDQNKGIAVEAQAWRTELARLKESPEVTRVIRTARKAFADAQVAEAAYLNLMKRGSVEFGKMKMSPAERQALKKAISAYRAVAHTYPDTSVAAPATDAADSLDVALAKAE